MRSDRAVDPWARRLSEVRKNRSEPVGNRSGQCGDFQESGDIAPTVSTVAPTDSGNPGPRLRRARCLTQESHTLRPFLLPHNPTYISSIPEKTAHGSRIHTEG